MAEHQDPNAAPHKPFLMEGDYAPGDAHLMNQEKRRMLAREEGSTIGGLSPHWPDRAHPLSQEEWEREQETAAYRRACHGGLPDSSDENPSIAVPGGKPFTV